MLNVKINISEELINKLPEFTVIGYTLTVDNNKTIEVDQLIQETKIKYQNFVELTDVVKIPKRIHIDCFEKIPVFFIDEITKRAIPINTHI